MKLLKKPCDHCGAFTSLMYKTTDGNGNDIDHYVCLNCLIDEIRRTVTSYALMKNPKYKGYNDSYVLDRVWLKHILDIDEAITIHLEFADVKIQRTKPIIDYVSREPNDDREWFVVIIRSIVNNQYHVRPFTTCSIENALDIVKRIFNEEFKDNSYPIDMTTTI